MLTSATNRYVLGLCAAASVLVGCGAQDDAPAMGSPMAAVHANPALAYRVLYRFGSASAKDGADPAAPLTDLNGILYGTTSAGGTGTGCGDGCGTVFSISARGVEKVLYSFAGGSDGSNPLAGLVDVNGTLYGTTYYGGRGCGTVFSISPGGAEEVLYAFTCGSDGGYPESGLLDVNGKLYGTTVFGGDLSCSGYKPGCGTVYSVTTSGSERVLHKFTGGSDGEIPFSGLTDVRGTLYGTTAFGGSGGCSEPCGTIYRVTTGGAEKVIYSFGLSGDGSYPHTGLVNVNGVLYGTTLFGGTGCGGGSGYSEGCGVVYGVTTSGELTVLHEFTGGSDGSTPRGELLDVNGTLYGTTSRGGTEHGSGTVYSISTSGDERVVHAFTGTPGGKHPAAGLIEIKGTLYGTTADFGDLGCGGGFYKGCGTVFTLHKAP